MFLSLPSYLSLRSTSKLTSETLKVNTNADKEYWSIAAGSWMRCRGSEEEEVMASYCNLSRWLGGNPRNVPESSNITEYHRVRYGVPMTLPLSDEFAPSFRVMEGGRLAYLGRDGDVRVKGKVEGGRTRGERGYFVDSDDEGDDEEARSGVSANEGEDVVLCGVGGEWGPIDSKGNAIMGARERGRDKCEFRVWKEREGEWDEHSIVLEGRLEYLDVEPVGMHAYVVRGGEEDKTVVSKHAMTGQSRGKEVGGMQCGGTVTAINVEPPEEGRGGRIVVCTSNGGVEVWDLDKGERVWNMNVGEEGGQGRNIYLNGREGEGGIVKTGFFTEHTGAGNDISSFTNSPLKQLKYWQFSKERGTFEVTTTVKHRLQECSVEFWGRMLVVFGVEGNGGNGGGGGYEEKAMVKIYHVLNTAFDVNLHEGFLSVAVTMRGGVVDEREGGRWGEMGPVIVLRRRVESRFWGLHRVYNRFFSNVVAVSDHYLVCNTGARGLVFWNMNKG